MPTARPHHRTSSRPYTPSGDLTRAASNRGQPTHARWRVTAGRRRTVEMRGAPKALPAHAEKVRRVPALFPCFTLNQMAKFQPFSRALDAHMPTVY
jgi:hypothetical protein